MPARPKINRDDMIRRYQAGEPLKQIATDMGCTLSGVHQALRKAGVEAVRTVRVDREAIQQLIAQGVSRIEAARRLGIHIATVYRVCPPAGTAA